jgi:hypothetical protein
MELKANRGSPEQNVCFWGGVGVEFQELMRTGERTAVFLEAVPVFLETNQSPQLQTAKYSFLISLLKNHKLPTIVWPRTYSGFKDKKEPSVEKLTNLPRSKGEYIGLSSTIQFVAT